MAFGSPREKPVDKQVRGEPIDDPLVDIGLHCDELSHLFALVPVQRR